MTQGYRLYVTYRSEYLVLRDMCVGVRDRASSAWLPMHAATCSHVVGPLEAPAADPVLAGTIRVGEHLCLHTSARRVVTGQIVAVEQPSRELLRQAERQWQRAFHTQDVRHTAMLLVPSQ